jgi:hypothetical protein
MQMAIESAENDNADLTRKKLEIEVRVLEAKANLEAEKLRLEIAALQVKSPLESEKLRIESDVLRKGFVRSLARHS